MMVDECWASIFFGEEEDDTLPKTKIAPARRPGLPQKGKDHLLLLMFFFVRTVRFQGCIKICVFSCQVLKGFTDKEYH